MHLIHSVRASLRAGNYKPTPTHFFIKLLHDKGLLLRAFTQNIDSLEHEVRNSGSKCVPGNRCSCMHVCIIAAWVHACRWSHHLAVCSAWLVWCGLQRLCNAAVDDWRVRELEQEQGRMDGYGWILPSACF